MSKRGLTSLLFVLGADIKEFQTELRKSTRDMQKWGRDMEKTGKSMSTYITAPIVAMGAASVVAFRNLNEAMKQVEAGIASTGGAAGFTSDHLKEMADDMGRLTATLNQDILQNVTAQLLTFTNITGQAFEEAQMAALNLSARMGTDLRSSAMMVGRALNDPIQGLTALSRAGVQFTNDQREAVKALIETGDAAGAQAIILQELETQFGGSAEAAGDAFSHMKNASIELGQAYGELISNAITPMVEQITGMIHWITDLDDSKKRWILTIGGIAAAIGPVLTIMGYMAARVIPNTLRGINMMIRAFRALRVAMMANPWMAVAAGVAALTTAVVLLRRRTNELSVAEESRARISNNLNTEYDRQAAKVQMLTSVIENEALSLHKRREAIEDLNRIMPDYNANLDDEGRLHDHNTKTIEDGLTAMKERIALGLVEAELTELMQKQREVKRELTKAEEELETAEKHRAAHTETLKSGRTDSRSVTGFTGDIREQQRAVDRATKASNELQEAISSLKGEYQQMMQTTSSFGEVEEDLNDEVKERIGILKQLNDEIKDLRDLEQKASTPQQIAEIRDLIIAKEEEIESIENQIRAYQLLNEIKGKAPNRMTGVGLEDTPPDIPTREASLPVDTEAIEVMQRYREALQNATAANNIFGESFDLVNAEIGATHNAIRQLIDLGFDESDEVIQMLINSLHQLEDGLENTTGSFSDFANVIQSGIQNAATSFAEGIGEMVAGTGSLQGVFSGVLDSIASTLEDLGKLAIATGVAIDGIRNALKSLNPMVAIVGGAALIALASVVRARAASMADGGSGGSGIPKMAMGGVVPPGFPNDTYPALLSSGEKVVPAPGPIEQEAPGNKEMVARLEGAGSDLYIWLKEVERRIGNI